MSDRLELEEIKEITGRLVSLYVSGEVDGLYFIYAKSLRQREGAAPFIFYEGPPTANGRPGIHHIFARTIKDLICRFRVMDGRQVTRERFQHQIHHRLAVGHCVVLRPAHGLDVVVEVPRAFGEVRQVPVRQQQAAALRVALGQLDEIGADGVADAADAVGVVRIQAEVRRGGGQGARQEDGP